ncbi:MAG: MmcQ/YjbR family DNA-binding protein [Clostridiales bacterium]|nr:MmcQ/YjbR family DNA-binding protein [Clostridiales bacterium]MBS5878195.1 MmcQ/YjbR family DNA-binding protein [Clostridiales bacterium]
MRVFRHKENNKWYGLIMDVPRDKLGLEGDERVDIINVKLDDPILADELVRQKGFFKGYHIRGGNWVSVLLDGTIPLERICEMIDISFITTEAKK